MLHLIKNVIKMSLNDTWLKFWILKFNLKWLFTNIKIYLGRRFGQHTVWLPCIVRRSFQYCTYGLSYKQSYRLIYSSAFPKRNPRSEINTEYFHQNSMIIHKTKYFLIILGRKSGRKKSNWRQPSGNEKAILELIGIKS